MYYLWKYKDDNTLVRTEHRPVYGKDWIVKPKGWSSRQAAHAYAKRHGIDCIVLKEREGKQIDLEDYIKKKGR